MAGSEVDVKPCDQGVDEIIPAAVERKWDREGQVSSRAGVEIKSDDSSGVSHNSFDFDGVNKGLRERGVLERSVVEAIDIVPDCNVSAVALFTG